MELYEALKTRRSIRSYTRDDVSDALIEKIIAAAMQAPSAGNQQPWQFIVVRDRAALDSVPGYHPYCKMIEQAQVAILVCGDPEGKDWPDFWVQDCSAAVQNLLLAARAEGLGTVWTGIYPVEERINGFRATFELPQRIIPFAMVPVGWPGKQSFKEINRYNAALIHRERFGQ